ncbi:DpnD/PcfM family protein [[Clostridium] innocuum]|nr:DpnD/PcfM family protein [[Clostridium] innocuum]
MPKFRIRKECRTMNEYDITIRETLEMTVTVEAASREEARQIAADRWKNGEYILDADSFKDVEFYPRGRSRDRDER